MSKDAAEQLSRLRFPANRETFAGTNNFLIFPLRILYGRSGEMKLLKAAQAGRKREWQHIARADR